MSIRLNGNASQQILQTKNLTVKGTNANASNATTNSATTVENITSQYKNGELTAAEAMKKLAELGAQNVTQKKIGNNVVIEFDLNGKHYAINGSDNKDVGTINKNQSAQLCGIGSWFKKIGSWIASAAISIVCPPLGFALTFIRLGLCLAHRDSSTMFR